MTTDNTAISPLFWLPVELLEEISQFLTRSESALVLVVDRTLHSVFARRIWRSIGLESHIWSAPSSAWTRYGHLVRSLYIPGDVDDASKIPNLPHLLRLEVRLTAATSRVFDYEMPLLQNLVIVSSESSSSTQGADIKRAAEWIYAVQASERHVKVQWHLELSSESNINWINELIDKISNTEHHAFNIDVSGDQIHVNQMGKLASMLTGLSLMSYLVNVSDGSAPSNLLTDSKLVFGRLRELSIDLSVIGEHALKITSVVDARNRFPCLECLAVSYSEDINLDSARLLFSPGSWSTMTTMRLLYCSQDVWDAGVQSVPNLRELRLIYSSLLLDPQIMATHIPSLQQLVIDEGSDVRFNTVSYMESEIASELGQLVNLRDFSFTRVEVEYPGLDIDMYEFILMHAPRLERVNLSWFGPGEYFVEGCTNDSVSQLTLALYNESLSDDEIDEIVGLFPKLNRLQVCETPPCTGLLNRLRERYPGIEVNEVNVHRDSYWTSSANLLLHNLEI